MGARGCRIVLLVVAITCVLAATAGFRLYLKDGSYHLVREYQVEGDRVRYYSTERGDWEEIPLDLLDLKRTEEERRQRQQALEKEASIFSAEEAARRELLREIARVPQEPGVYLIEGERLRVLKQAESKAVTNKGRTVLKVLTPVPLIAGEATVELDGTRSPETVDTPQPEFYFRVAAEERFGIFKLTPKEDSRVVQKWTIMPVTNEILEEQQEVQIFRRQLEPGLYKIWPMDPLEPGEYAVVEYTPGQKNIQVWDFAWRPAGQETAPKKKAPSSDKRKR
ncbi:MAG: hypothetical protein ACUVXB_06380 [Bryobacteraceae bacterium]